MKLDPPAGRSDAKYIGVREKRAKEKAEKAEQEKAKQAK